MAWSIRFDEAALAQMRKLDKTVARRIIAYLRETAESDDPRTRGKPLSANLAGLWRYRIGDYRVICEILNERMTIYALQVGHRSRIYPH